METVSYSIFSSLLSLPHDLSPSLHVCFSLWFPSNLFLFVSFLTVLDTYQIIHYGIQTLGVGLLTRCSLKDWKTLANLRKIKLTMSLFLIRDYGDAPKCSVKHKDTGNLQLVVFGVWGLGFGKQRCESRDQIWGSVCSLFSWS